MSARAKTISRYAAAAAQAPNKAKACPICGKSLSGKTEAEAYRPFCSKACADIDLSRWLGGRYAIPGAPAPDAGPDADDQA